MAQPPSPLATVKMVLPFGVMMFRTRVNEAFPVHIQIQVFAALVILKVCSRGPISPPAAPCVHGDTSAPNDARAPRRARPGPLARPARSPRFLRLLSRVGQRSALVGSRCRDLRAHRLPAHRSWPSRFCPG